LIRSLFILWNRLKPFEQFALWTETVFWTLNRLVPIEVHYMEKILECFHQKPSLRFDWRKKDMDILGYMGVSKLSAKVFFKVTTPSYKLKMDIIRRSNAFFLKKHKLSNRWQKVWRLWFWFFSNFFYIYFYHAGNLEALEIFLSNMTQLAITFIFSWNHQYRPNA